MSLQWKDLEIEQKYPSHGLPNKISDIGINEMTISEAKKHPPRRFVEKVEKWCVKNNAETVGYKKNIRKHLGSYQADFLWNFLLDNQLQEFTVRDLIRYMDADNYTDGSLQRSLLSLFVCKGLVKKHRIEYKDKKGRIKPKMVYSVVGRLNKVDCPYLKEDKCTFNWKQAQTTKYFTGEGK